MTPKNTICVWYDREAEEAARFYASVFPDSEVRAIHRSPMDNPGNQAGEVMVVEFTVCGIPCIGLKDGLQNPRATLLPGLLRSGDDASHEAS